MNTIQHDGNTDLVESHDFFRVAERKASSEGMVRLLVEISEAESLNIAMQIIVKTIETQGIQAPSKLHSLSPEAPSTGQFLEAHLLTPRSDGMPYTAADLRIFKPYEQDLVGISYRRQNPDHSPAMTEIEIVGPTDTKTNASFTIITRSRTYDQIEKWGLPEEVTTITESPDGILDALQAVSTDSLAFLG